MEGNEHVPANVPASAATIATVKAGREMLNKAINLVSLAINENEDDSEDEMLLGLVSLQADHSRRPDLRTPPRLHGFVENIVSQYLPGEFQENFRVSAETANNLECIISPLLKRQRDEGRNTVSPRKQILSVIWLLATPDSYRSVGQQFGMSKSTLHHCFRRVYKALNDIAPQNIRWPTQTEKLAIKQKFQAMSDLPDIIGAIDGCQIEIDAPMDQPAAYRTGKKKYSIQVQAVCDPDLLFTDIFAGYPGSVHDARIFRNSPLYRDATMLFEGNEYIIGDKAYPVLLWCIPPYKNLGNLTQAERNFNTKLSSTRQTIERAFCLLKGRFRRMKHLAMLRTDEISPTILATCVLHNLCLRGVDEPRALIEEYINEGHEETLQENWPREPAPDAESSAAANSKRDYLKNLLFNN